jgi:hypothetical protein
VSQHISFIPRVDVSQHGDIALYGRGDPGVAWEGGPKVGARITADTRCARCAKPFLAGHVITADLAPNMAGVARHTDCDDPKLEDE